MGPIETDIFDVEKGFAFRYFKIVYHSVLIYSMVEITPRNFFSIIFLICLYILSAIINAIIYGQFAVLTEELMRDKNNFIDKFDEANGVMYTENVPEQLVHDVRAHILQTHSLKRDQEEQFQFNKNLSNSM